MPLLSGEFWVEVDPLVEVETNLETSDDQILVLLTEARYVFSGMIYGFEFRYVPLDLGRDVAEEFELDPVAEIPWGDPGIIVAESRYENGRLYALIRYWVPREQRAWIDFWGSNVHPSVSAFGTGDFLEGRPAKFSSFYDGIRESIRGYLRPREANKPREIAGRIAFSQVPYVVIDGGVYRSRVEVKLDIRNIIPYKVY